MNHPTAFAGLLLVLGIATGAGQLKRTVNVHRAEYVPPLTGTLTHPIWRDASVFTSFQTVTPEAGKRPSERMAAYLLYDNDNVYAALRMDDRQKASIRSSAKSASEIESDDWAALCFRLTEGPGPTFYFQVNPAGVQANGTLDASGKMIQEALKPWRVVARKVPTGWIAEISIPFSTLGVHKDQAVMGFKAMRHLSRVSETSEGPGDPWQSIRFSAQK